MSRVGLQILVAVFVMASIENASGCQCTTLHPQQHYCRALYVVRAKVESLQWQLIQRLPTEPHTVPDTVTDTLPSGYTSTPTTETKNQTVTVGTSPKLQTTSRSPVSVTTIKADEATEKSVSETDPVSNPNATGTDSQDGKGSPSWPHLDAMPAHRRDDEALKSIISQEPWNYEILYTVKIEKAYKTVEGKVSMREGEEVQIKSFYPGGMFCGVELKKGKSYVLGGAIQGQIGRCDLILEYKTISKRQKQGLRSNYGQYCEKCQIATCHSPQCAAHLPENTCAYMAHDSYDRHGIGYQEDDCIAAHSKCIPKEGHEMCQWQRNKDLKECLSETGVDRRPNVNLGLRRHRQSQRRP